MIVRQTQDKVVLGTGEVLDPDEAATLAAQIADAALVAKAWKPPIPGGFKDGDVVAGPFGRYNSEVGHAEAGLGVVDSAIQTYGSDLVPVRVTHGVRMSGGYFPTSVVKVPKGF